MLSREVIKDKYSSWSHLRHSHALRYLAPYIGKCPRVCLAIETIQSLIYQSPPRTPVSEDEHCERVYFDLALSTFKGCCFMNAFTSFPMQLGASFVLHCERSGREQHEYFRQHQTSKLLRSPLAIQRSIHYLHNESLLPRWAGIANKFICGSRTRHLLLISQNSTFVDISQNYEIENRNELWN